MRSRRSLSPWAPKAPRATAKKPKTAARRSAVELFINGRESGALETALHLGILHKELPYFLCAIVLNHDEDWALVNAQFVGIPPRKRQVEGIAPRLLNVANIGDEVRIYDTGAYCASMRAKGYNSFPDAGEVMVD